MKSRLFSCAIIPQELYVERAADRQLARVIDEMGRPGYVLVSRQMGKTNLLLHSKRNSPSNDLYVYVDVSNTVPDLRTFLRGIVDACIEGLGDDNLRESVLRKRSSSYQFLEHKEHELELRDVLKSSAGKVVIFLDEIDALTKVDYSDQVFSFIRSTYFSGRTNFREFLRLTYILSGVAEPTEIIKNRSISPFNIGEKIYLDDFSVDEYRKLLEQAGIVWDSRIIDRIYSWTSGNPRLAWDLSAAIEIRGVDSSVVDAAVVDEVVGELYLTSFDLPPVDHIRTLAQADKDIRSAVMSMHYGKGNSISDYTRSKLYLAGIISGAAVGGLPKLKNRIIEQSLSERWLSDVGSAQSPSLALAKDFLAEGKFVEALNAYQELEKSGVEFDVELVGYQKAYCQYSLGNNRDALLELEDRIYPKAKSLDLYLASNSLLASIQLVLGMVEESITSFERVVREGVVDDHEQPAVFAKARVSLAAAYLAQEAPNTRRVRELCNSVIASVAKPEVGSGLEDADAELVASANFNLFKACMVEADYEQGRSHLRDAIEVSRPAERSVLLLDDCLTFCVGEERAHGLEMSARHLIENGVRVRSRARFDRRLLFTGDHASALCYHLESCGSNAVLSELVEYLHRADVGHEITSFEMIAGAAMEGVRVDDPGIVAALLGRAIALPRMGLVEGSAFAYAMYVTFCDDFDLDKCLRMFVDEQDGEHKVEPLFQHASHRLCKNLIDAGRARDALAVIENVQKLADTCDPGIRKVSTLAGYFWRSAALSSLGRKKDASRCIRDLYVALSGDVDLSDSYYDPQDITTMRSMLLASFRDELSPAKFIGTPEKFGRNQLVDVRLVDGTVRTMKYKKATKIVALGGASIMGEGVSVGP